MKSDTITDQMTAALLATNEPATYAAMGYQPVSIDAMTNAAVDAAIAVTPHEYFTRWVDDFWRTGKTKSLRDGTDAGDKVRGPTCKAFGEAYRRGDEAAEAAIDTVMNTTPMGVSYRAARTIAAAYSKGWRPITEGKEIGTQ